MSGLFQGVEIQETTNQKTIKNNSGKGKNQAKERKAEKKRKHEAESHVFFLIF